MPTIDELTNQPNEPELITDEFTSGEVEEPQRRGIDLSFLRAETGEGSIEEYMDHPMNPNRSRALAQLLRGFTGLFGSLRLAIIDIALGALNFAKERKQVVDVRSSPRGFAE